MIEEKWRKDAENMTVHHACGNAMLAAVIR